MKTLKLVQKIFFLRNWIIFFFKANSRACRAVLIFFFVKKSWRVHK
jgi:hypothetical protein